MRRLKNIAIVTNLWIRLERRGHKYGPQRATKRIAEFEGKGYRYVVCSLHCWVRDHDRRVNLRRHDSACACALDRSVIDRTVGTGRDEGRHVHTKQRSLLGS